MQVLQKFILTCQIGELGSYFLFIFSLWVQILCLSHYMLSFRGCSMFSIFFCTISAGFLLILRILNFLAHFCQFRDYAKLCKIHWKISILSYRKNSKLWKILKLVKIISYVCIMILSFGSSFYKVVFRDYGWKYWFFHRFLWWKCF